MDRNINKCHRAKWHKSKDFRILKCKSPIKRIGLVKEILL